MTDTAALPTERTIFQSLRNNITRTQVVTAPVADLAPGEVLVAVDCFALTANNITYGVAGDLIGYWQFFPAHDPADEGWGCIPVWGFGDVIASESAGVPVGERLYGYFPMASHVVLQPENVRSHSLVDGASHRAALPVVYNQYQRTSADANYQRDQDAEQMLYRPLFTTSFLIDDFLDDNQFFGAGTVVLTSASSKTSLGLAQLLKRNRDCQVVGLTSAANQAFVEATGCYHQVLDYSQVDQLAPVETVLVDMAGNAQVREAVHQQLAEQLRYSCGVGATHWDAASVGAGDAKSLPGPKPEMFFAPSQIQKRYKDWGADEYNKRLATAWDAFLGDAGGWISVRESSGAEALAAVYQAQVGGTADPAAGYVMSLRTP